MVDRDGFVSFLNHLLFRALTVSAPYFSFLRTELTIESIVVLNL